MDLSGSVDINDMVYEVVYSGQLIGNTHFYCGIRIADVASNLMYREIILSDILSGRESPEPKFLRYSIAGDWLSSIP